MGSKEQRLTPLLRLPVTRLRRHWKPTPVAPGRKGGEEEEERLEEPLLLRGSCYSSFSSSPQASLPIFGFPISTPEIPGRGRARVLPVIGLTVGTKPQGPAVRQGSS